jgi:hypothetical protein
MRNGSWTVSPVFLKILLSYLGILVKYETYLEADICSADLVISGSVNGFQDN